MTVRQGIKLLTEILNIEGIKVISQRQHEGIGIILQIEPIGKESMVLQYLVCQINSRATKKERIM